MKEPVQIPPNHSSYKDHRRQFWLQIFIPVILFALIIIAIGVMAGVAAFGENGDPSRWAAISTIWLVIPVLVFSFLFFVILAGLVYLLARILKVIPSYSFEAQSLFARATDQAKRFSNMATKPIFFIEGIIASLKAFFGKNY